MAGVRSAGLVMGDGGLFDAARLSDASRRRSQLVVLSACASARGTTGLFDDDDSLVKRLEGAGVPDVVASRWMVNSSATAALMQSFYGQLLAGQTVSDSLDRASRSLRNNPNFVHPYYWAGFAVFGIG